MLITDNLGGPADVTVVNVLSGAETVLTPADHTVADFDPAWAPSGGQIVLVRQPYLPNPLACATRTSSLDVYTVKADGTGPGLPSSRTGTGTQRSTSRGWTARGLSTCLEVREPTFRCNGPGEPAAAEGRVSADAVAGCRRSAALDTVVPGSGVGETPA